MTIAVGLGRHFNRLSMSVNAEHDPRSRLGNCTAAGIADFVAQEFVVGAGPVAGDRVAARFRGRLCPLGWRAERTRPLRGCLGGIRARAVTRPFDDGCIFRNRQCKDLSVRRRSALESHGNRREGCACRSACGSALRPRQGLRRFGSLRRSLRAFRRR